MIIGLTGPTGSGKSTASRIAEQLSFKVIDCDFLARKAVEKGTDGLSALVSAFGSDILNPDGSLCRKALAKKAFSSPQNTKLLNETLLPHISALVKQEAVGDKVLLDAPTLYESGLDSECSFTVAVLADLELRLNRIMKRDSLNEADALLRINAGKMDDFYNERADYIIYNNGDEDKFIAEFKEILNNRSEFYGRE